MKNPGNDTIAAVATGAGGGIGIVRISGPDAIAIADRIFRGRDGRRLEEHAPFRLVLGTAHDPDSAEPIDEVLAVHMPRGRSYTGEPVVEIQGHGGRVVLESLLRAALRAGARHAGPGEFTRRAFLCGRLDLTQAEAVAGLIGAEDEAAQRAALRQLHGAVAGEIDRLRERLLDLVARVEAAIDFEEGEIPEDLPSASEFSDLAGAIRLLAARASGGGAAGGVRVAIAGRANTGKSSIFNYLLAFDRSIVAPAPGTTRDYVEERSLIGGSSVTLVDTAGLRPTDDTVEAEGVRRSVEQIGEADVVILVLDGSERLQPQDRRLFEIAADRSPIVVVSKSDLPSRLEAAAVRSLTAGLSAFPLSTVTGEGFPEFVEALTARCRGVLPELGPADATPNIRHRDALERGAASLDAAMALACAEGGSLDRVAVECRAALDALGEITGQTATEDILERVFSRFCVGK